MHVISCLFLIFFTISVTMLPIQPYKVANELNQHRLGTEDCWNMIYHHLSWCCETKLSVYREPSCSFLNILQCKTPLPHYLLPSTFSHGNHQMPFLYYSTIKIKWPFNRTFLLFCELHACSMYSTNVRPTIIAGGQLQLAIWKAVQETELHVAIHR